MLRGFLITTLLISVQLMAKGQVPQRDTIPAAADTADDLPDLLPDDELMSDLESFLDSLLAPRSFFSVNLSAVKGYFNYKTDRPLQVDTRSRFIYSPSAGYFHKSGPGISATAFIVSEGRGLNLYQYSFTPSFDYLRNMDFAAGISYTRFFSSDSLPFYVSPLKNEANAYLTIRKWWVQPSLSLSYGWGQRADVEDKLEFIESLWLRRRLLNLLNDMPEPVYDFSVTASLLHHFYKMDIFSSKDFIRFTPQIIFNAGTQQFGFNQQNNYFFTRYSRLTRTNLLNTARGMSLSADDRFQALSLGLNTALEYGTGKFFIRPGLLLDYYFPAKENNFTALFSVNAGLMF